MGALIAAEALAAVARTVLDSLNSDCSAELPRLLQQEKDDKPDATAIAIRLLDEIRTAIRDENNMATATVVLAKPDSRVPAEEASRKTTGRENPCTRLGKDCSEFREKERQGEGSRAQGKEEMKET